MSVKVPLFWQTVGQFPQKSVFRLFFFISLAVKKISFEGIILSRAAGIFFVDGWNWYASPKVQSVIFL